MNFVVSLCATSNMTTIFRVVKAGEPIAKFILERIVPSQIKRVEYFTKLYEKP